MRYYFMKPMLMLLLLLLCFGLCDAKPFDIQAFSDTTQYNWQDYRDRASYREDLLLRQNRLQLYELESVPFNANLLKSAVVPGWGQFATKHDTKATVILSLELVTVIGAVYFHNQAKNNYDKYFEADQIDDINNYWGKAEKPYHYSLMLVGLASVIWGYNIYDVVISTNEYNAKLWDDIMQRQGSSPLQITPNGLELRF
ncbi:MAG: hypothetical protein LHW64_05875 [Candidatus Cloacimonetes bacterium]|nr:hypothetical protein [Candidatus Cloacimonadota bacterium]MCB5287311.1 hypothetical protein [Candidatus Cloacimonadota bacterium]MCK9184648.1 hypothetical protein [Candidatus Cloacimonadota bacterium]MCK9583413.1 hypothetical protein [Candidatus Cloacimonadota bacterium]MDY0229633.1 hypothetical protein [Candidatus Cloacimonadaceae bacterium]